MKKLTILIILLLLISLSANAYVTPEDYKGTKLKFYSPYINRTQCINLLDSIPGEYLEGLRYIKFHYTYTRRGILGYYWWYNGIDIFGCQTDCNLDVLIHELAHHCQLQEGDYFYLALRHSGHFEECEEKIINSLHTVA